MGAGSDGVVHDGAWVAGYGSARATAASTTDLTANFNVTAQAGDLIVASAVGAGGSGWLLMSATGYSVTQQQSSNATFSQLVRLWKVAAGGETSITVSVGGAGSMRAVAVVLIRNSDGVLRNELTNLTATADSQGTIDSTSLAVAMFGDILTDANITSSVSGSGWAEQVENCSNFTAAGFDLNGCTMIATSAGGVTVAPTATFSAGTPDKLYSRSFYVNKA